MNIDQETRESRGSVSYTDYYSNEDGQIRRSADNCFPLFLKTTRATAEDPGTDGAAGSAEEEEHTLTLKQAEEDKKQDVQQIFEDKMVKPGSSYKKIGRYGLYFYSKNF